jgi:hypothetical protein
MLIWEGLSMTDDVKHWLALLADGKATLSKSEMWDIAQVISRLNAENERLVRERDTAVRRNTEIEFANEANIKAAREFKARALAAEARLRQAVEVMRQRAVDLRRNSSGGDDYDWAAGKFAAAILETMARDLVAGQPMGGGT